MGSSVGGRKKPDQGPAYRQIRAVPDRADHPDMRVAGALLPRPASVPNGGSGSHLSLDGGRRA